MSQMIQGFNHSDDGRLYTFFRPSTGIVATEPRIQGWAVNAEDASAYVFDATSAAFPAGTRLVQGLAYTDDGALCVDTGTPVLGRYINGMAVRADGAAYVTFAAPSSPRFFNGRAYDSLGRMHLGVYVSDLTGISEMWDGGINVTVTGSGVSSWVGLKLGQTFSQGTDTNRPGYSGNTITFDGVDNFLSAAVAVPQPCTFYFAGLIQISWTDGERILSGAPTNVAFFQNSASPTLSLFAGTGVVANNTDLTISAKQPVAVGYNGASSFIQVGSGGTPTTGNAGTSNFDSLNLAVNQTLGSQFANFSLTGFGYSTTLNSVAQRNQVLAAMARRG